MGLQNRRYEVSGGKVVISVDVCNRAVVSQDMSRQSWTRADFLGPNPTKESKARFWPEIM